MDTPLFYWMAETIPFHSKICFDALKQPFHGISTTVKLEITEKANFKSLFVHISNVSSFQRDFIQRYFFC